MNTKLLTYGNSKLKQQLVFDLPVSKTICNRTCPGCYALKAQRRFPAVLAKRERMHLAALDPSFTSKIISEISACKKPLTAVRIHSSGEFYSQDYINKWQAIAIACPTVKFYAFTKRIKEFDFTSIMALPNVVIIDSLMHGGLNYGKLATLRSTVFTCPTTGCGTSCKYCMTKAAQNNGVQFVQH